MAKRYYWLKLQHDFFNEKRIKKLRKIAGGDTYTIIYLKMQLLSLQNEGKLYFDNVENTFEEEMALELDEDIEDVKVTIMYLMSCGLMEKVEDEYTLIDTQKNIGSETEGAERVRKFRKKHNEMLQCNNDVTMCNIEKRREEKEIDKDIDKKYIVEDNSSLTKEVIDYLNLKLKSNYKTTTRETIKHINARKKEGYCLEDFKIVIDKKFDEWYGTDMQKYLRPDTLFGTKFENYLNQEIYKKKNKTEQLDELFKKMEEKYDHTRNE